MMQEIENALKVLKAGGVILYPTDTIWGLGCDATDEKAVDRVIRIKGRQPGKHLLVLLDSIAKLERYASVPDIAWDLLEQITTPLTIIYPDGRNLAKNLLAEDHSIGIRVSSDPFCRELIKRFGKPIVSTSANFSGEPFPKTFREINPGLLESVDYAVDWNRDKINSVKASDIIRISMKGEIVLLRS